MSKIISFVINSMQNSGGCERVTANLANILSDMGYKIYIFPLYGKTSFFHLNNSICFIPLENNTKDSLFNRSRLLIKTINTIRPNTVIGISINKLNVCLSICSFFFRPQINLIASDHISFNSSGKFIKLLKKIFYKKYNHIVLLTNDDRIIYQNMGFKNIITIPNISSYSPVDVTPVLKREKIILSIGRLAYQKGFDRLLNIWSQIYFKYPEWKVLIIGEGEDEQMLKGIIEQYPNFSCQILHFTKEIVEFYSNAQIYALTSRFEGLPMVLIEALSYGCPIISYDCQTGPKDIVIDNNNGFLIEDANESDFVRQLMTMIESDSLREKFHKEALIMRKKFERDSIINEWQTII